MKVTISARDRAMTLAELAELVEQARGLGLEPTTPIKATVRLNGDLKSVTVGES